MRRELLVHFSFLLLLFVLITLFKKWIPTSLEAFLFYLPFWVGGILGTILPDLDHLIYVYYLRPQDLTSQRAASLIDQRQIWNSLDLLASTRNERTGLIFHTVLFQIIFAVLAFWVISSSGSMFGRGLVLAFVLHLVIDQFVDLMKVGNLYNWFKQVGWQLTREKETIYWVGNLIIVLIFGFLM